MSRLKRSNKSVYNIAYHIIWSPKCRAKILKNEIEYRLKEILINKAIEIDCFIENIECMPDHIHIFIKADTKICVQYIVKILKGYSSYILRKEFPWLKKYKALWSRSYYCESIGHISESTIKKYIDDQKSKI